MSYNRHNFGRRENVMISRLPLKFFNSTQYIVLHETQQIEVTKLIPMNTIYITIEVFTCVFLKVVAELKPQYILYI